MPPIRLAPGDYRVMPWKNGGGTTSELAVHPPGAGLDDFLWRVSVADVAASGPFSAFAGIERTIMLLAGAPMTLRGPAGTATLTRHVPHRFAGEDAVEGILSAGPVRDFNVMARRGRVQSDVAVLRAGRHASTARNGALLIYCAEGSAQAAIGTGAPVALAAGETLLERALADATLIIVDAADGAVVIRVGLAASPPG